MKDRLTTLFMAIAALLLALFLLNPPVAENPQTLSLPTTEDRGIDGLKGLYHWLQSNHIPVLSLRNRYSELANMPELTPSGNMLIISTPQHQPALKSEWRALSRWLNQGNSLIILGAAYSEPGWAQQQSCFCEIKTILKRHGWLLTDNQDDQPYDPADDEDLTLSRTLDKIQASVDLITPVTTTIKPTVQLAILASVTGISGELTPALVEQQWQLTALNSSVALRLLSLDDAQATPVLWQINNQSKPIYLSLLPDLFANKKLDQASNAQLIANVITHNLDSGGQVIFDDYHFGLSNLYDPERFFSDPRLHQTLAFIGLLWLLYVAGYTNRLAPVKVQLAKPSSVDFVEAMAGFFTHRIDKRNLGHALVKHLIQDIRRQRHLPDDHETWLWLEQHAQIKSGQLSLIKRAHQRQRTPLKHVTNTITQIRSTLLL